MLFSRCDQVFPKSPLDPMIPAHHTVFVNQLRLRLANYIRALEVLVQKGEPEPNARMALGSIVECLTLVMSTAERGPDAVPPFSLSTAVGTTSETTQARDIDVTTIKHDARAYVARPRACPNAAHPLLPRQSNIDRFRPGFDGWNDQHRFRNVDRALHHIACPHRRPALAIRSLHPEGRDQSHQDSGSEDTLVEAESSDQLSSEEEGRSSEGSEAAEGWEDEEDEGSSMGLSEVDTSAPATPSLHQPPGVIWQELLPPRFPMYLNRAALEDTSQWVNPLTRILWHESPPMVMTASDDNNNEARPLHPASPNTETGPLMGFHRRHSPSVEIINAVVRPAARRCLSERARRARQVAFLQERLEEDGLVFTGCADKLPAFGCQRTQVWTRSMSRNRVSLRPITIQGGCCLNKPESIFADLAGRDRPPGRPAAQHTGCNTEYAMHAIGSATRMHSSSRLMRHNPAPIVDDLPGLHMGAEFVGSSRHIHPHAEDLRSRLAEAFHAFPGSNKKHVFSWFRSGVNFEMRRFLGGVGNFLTDQTEYDFPEFVANRLAFADIESVGRHNENGVQDGYLGSQRINIAEQGERCGSSPPQSPKRSEKRNMSHHWGPGIGALAWCQYE
ncbi:hypothetical protein FIBSPDRAFT_892470 [Athelia psychrophila]|uniref:Uncharacterized protein n=1 Tax=Athelia psychrophila TaxID=1759441 RepID=A0A166IDB4_9AGAM|nr:hypothetical protein FIBSPDRAFT_892470 [Fibularhizoctonia sp. CBS 109695]